jgi:aminoglycoside phosphotransferase (APT) family kinase protein
MTTGLSVDLIGTALEAYLRSTSSEWARITSIRPFGDGHSGFTFLVAAEGAGGGQELVLRVSPPGTRIAGSADIGRQGRIMESVGAAGLPVPAIIACSSEGRLAGQSFLLSSRVDGDHWPQARDRLGDSMLFAMARDYLDRLQSLGPEQIAISHEAPFLPAAEAERWGRLLRHAPDSIAGPGRRLLTQLLETAPAPDQPVLAHGDFHYGNVLYSGTGIAAVVDWEVASMGDPLTDYGSLVVAALRKGWGDPNNTMGDIGTPVNEIMSVARDEQRARWFISAACSKYAAIFGYNLGLHRSGRRPDPIYEDLVDIAHLLNDYGERAITS